jgi:hypothetical protein
MKSKPSAIPADILAALTEAKCVAIGFDKKTGGISFSCGDGFLNTTIHRLLVRGIIDRVNSKQ